MATSYKIIQRDEDGTWTLGASKRSWMMGRDPSDPFGEEPATFYTPGYAEWWARRLQEEQDARRSDRITGPVLVRPVYR